MKYYIVLQPTIRSMGGEEMYTRNVLISAREMGYEPIVFHSGSGEKIYINDLKQYDQYEFPEFRYEPCVISKRKKHNLLKRIVSIIGNYDDETVIESHEILISEWGELIARELRVKHFVYMLLEHNTLNHGLLFDFYRFKYQRGELAGFEEPIIPDMFEKFEINVENSFLPAPCGNTYEDIPCDKKFKLGSADFTIGSIGRTNKKYVLPMIESIIEFVSRHKNYSFNILYVGGSMDKKSERTVVDRLSSLTNANLTFTGMIYPLSVDMIKQMDVCIASTDSCFISYNCGVPTISVDGNDSKAIGVFNVTTRNPLFRGENEPPIEIDKLLDDVLIKKMYNKEDRLELVTIDFSSHWEFINKMSSKKEYYDIDKIVYPFKRRLISRFLGFYYGLKPSSLLSRCIAKVIGFVK